MKFLNKYQTIGNCVFESVSELPSLTDESYKQECDIDFIISNFVQRGIEPPQHQIQYGKQFTSDDYQKSMETLAECKSAYEALPAIEKERFNNSVSNFLDFVANPDNLKESYEKGYIDPQSVNIEDVYPERFNKETSTSNFNNVSGSVNTPSNDVDVTVVNESHKGSATVTENPTQT